MVRFAAIRVPVEAVKGRDGRRHPYAVKQHTQADTIEMGRRRHAFAERFVSTALAAALHAREGELDAEASVPRIHVSHATVPLKPRIETQAASTVRAPTPQMADTPLVTSSHFPAVAREYTGRVAALRAQYRSAASAGSDASPAAAVPRHSKTLPPLPQRHVKGGAIGRSTRRSLIDDLVSPTRASSLTPTPGPAMLPYLEGRDTLHDGVPVVPRVASQWHRDPPREHTRRADIGCRPLYLPPLVSRPKGGAIGSCPR
jgi:hypothetical protein